MQKFTIGADISKDKINFAVRYCNEFILEMEVENNSKPLTKFIKEILAISKKYANENFHPSLIEFVMEHTGIYNTLLIACLAEHHIVTYVVPGLEIKNSLGINRGKNDRIDARRIAEYGVRFSDKLKPYSLPDKSLEKLKMLNTKRAQLVKIMSQLIQSDEDTKKFLGEESYRNMRFYINPVIKELSASIKMIEEEMLSIIKIDEQLFENYQFAVSVPGVGKVIAIAFICATNNFTKFETAKALGSYCGVVPFGRESGKYRGKEMVSPIANKKLKTLLHLGARATISGNNQFTKYYQRKIMDDKKIKCLL
ncbi:MAG: transposase [Saprospiraceae bacterium]|nr:transposase [Saprospiraceae bacterium]MBK8549435.1 transposase [Saprospiraceae bacterium]MBK8855168.1 transposase [Saprospiraceae bacterium]